MPPAIAPLLLCVCLLAVSLASASDLHPEGYEPDCPFCQFHKHSLVETAAGFSPSPPARAPERGAPRPNLTDRRDDSFHSAGCRAPPYVD